MAAASWAIVGGGMLGLTLAHRLSQQGKRVTVYEAADSIGGLAGVWQLDDIVWDRHYHVTLLSDAHLRGLLDELGLDDEMRWVVTRTGCFADQVMHSISSNLEFLRFPVLRMIDKLRLAATIVYASRLTDWRALEQVPVSEWLERLSGRRTYERLWLPLLRAKLGESYRDASAAFIWATIQRLYAARRSGLKREMFGYVPGGYRRVLEGLAGRLGDAGVDLRCGTRVREIVRRGGELRIAGDDFVSRHDRVVVTTDARVAARVCADLTDDERRDLGAIRYQGIVCASLLLDRPLAGYYLTYITDASIPYTAVVEMSALVDPAEFGGRHLVYLPKYVDPADPIFDEDDDTLRQRFTAGLAAMYPQFDPAQVTGWKVSRVRRVFAIPTLGFSQTLPPLRTSIPGLDIVNSAHIVNGTLNVNETVALAERVAADYAAEDGTAASVAAPILERPASGPLTAAVPAPLVARTVAGERAMESSS